MPLIHLKKVISCSSEDQAHRADNLLRPDEHQKRLSSKNPDERITSVVEFDRPSRISSIEIGNAGSAFIELLVSQQADDWHVLLPSTLLMTPKESRAKKNGQQIKSLKSFHLNKANVSEKWNRLKIVCEQKFNRVDAFGLSFIKLYSDGRTMPKALIDLGEEDETESEQKKVGALFAKKQLGRKSKLTTTDNSQPKDEQNDKSQIMKDVVFVLSGFQNPFRSELRDKATAMGATYNDDWDEQCTHLISAFPNTPKFAQVQKTGKGVIVGKQWILDCDEQNQLLSENSYALTDTSKRASTTKKRKIEDEPAESGDDTMKTPVKKKSMSKKEEVAKLKLGELPDFFHDMHFYVSYGDYNDSTLLDIIRVILAYDGILERQITTDVTYVITNRVWNQDFEKICKSKPDISFVNLDWIQDCHNANQFVPTQSYLVAP